MSTVNYCGKHVILEIWANVDDPKFCDEKGISDVMKSAAHDVGATVIDEHWHLFGKGYGITGVLLLSESHMSIHTWPEYGYAAVDIFMCGECDAALTVTPITQFFKTKEYKVINLIRGNL
jgi:S-adenosylmethionine decarboxylase